MKIYTRKGDDGTTSLVGGERVCKTHPRLEAYGTVDELSAQIGVLVSHIPADDSCLTVLMQIQNLLFVVGAQLATSEGESGCGSITNDNVEWLELTIDDISAGLPQLRSFVICGGAPAAAIAHVCRTVCRRAERRVLELAEEYDVDEELVRFMNRLSDFFFVLARYLNKTADVKEILWNNPCKCQ